MDMVSAVAVNKTLTFLDLSYNGLGNDAGELMGDSLMQNRVLRTLLLANNNFGSVAAFTLAVGVIDNPCIRRLNIDENPIGVAGAAAVMQVPVTIGSRCNLTSNNSNTKVRDDKCWFQQSSPAGEYNLRLDVPFERAVAISLLQIVAIHRTYIFSRVVYQRGNGKKQLKLVQGISKDSEQYFDDHQKHVIKGLRLIQEAAQNVELGTRLFREADRDNSGELDKDELRAVLNRMGFDKMDHEKMEDLMAVFDIDGAGTIVEEEFIQLLRSQAREANMRVEEMISYPIMALASSPTAKYVPPRKGVLSMNVIDGFVRKDNHKVISATDQKYALSMANSMGSIEHMDAVIKNTKLRLFEGAELYKKYHLETGDMASALAKILPQMVFSSEARHLMSKITKDDRVKISQVKRKVGVALKPILGMYNGYYVLDLKKELDRLCLSLLLEQSSSINSKMRAKDEELLGNSVIGDTSQKGNWASFRNELFNGEPFTITIKEFTPMRKEGILEFDFSGGQRPDGSELPISDRRLLKVLRNLALLSKDQMPVAEAKLKSWKAMAKKGEINVGWSIYETSLDKARSIGLAKEDFYAGLVERRDEVKKAVQREIIKVQLGSHKSVHKRRGSQDGSVMSVSTSLAGSDKRDDESLPSKEGKDDGEDSDIEDDEVFGELPSLPEPKRRGSDPDYSMNANDPRKASIISFGVREFSPPVHLHRLTEVLNENAPNVEEESEQLAGPSLLAEIEGDDHESGRGLEAEEDEEDAQQNARARIVDLKKRMFQLIRFHGAGVTSNAKASRICEVLEETFSKVWLRSRHLALIIEYFVYGSTPKAKRFGSYIVDLVCVLFSRIVDLHNFEIVMHMLSPLDCAAVICRVGWLNIFNPLKPDGSYEFEVGRHEERVLTKIIVQLSIDEPGLNLTYKQFQWKREMDPVPGWDVGEGWTRHDGLNWHGLFQFTYYSGDNVGKFECKPIPVLRKALTHLVLVDENDVFDEDSAPPITPANSLKIHYRRKQDRWDDYLLLKGLPNEFLTGSSSH
jgi:Ca2+-binding EF-hand superfamily protein